MSNEKHFSYVIDSDILIDHLRGYRCALEFIDTLTTDDVQVCFSVISEAEIYANVRPGEESIIEALFDSLSRVVVNGEIARKAGTYRAQYGPSHGVTLPDALIAATVFVIGAELFTRNARHYPMTDIKVRVPYALPQSPCAAE
ncbi:MAG TPA: type II toxin-antitoxin system VapC family toxin [Anaerolineae bacterium]|nr:type II toxin-antitoxin system VapC family toxin [Anaerolineae bacterium]HQI83744.1 type II toxin-antitoxin system VapC family toxin [Anaerolineae bacterium]